MLGQERVLEGLSVPGRVAQSARLYAERVSHLGDISQDGNLWIGSDAAPWSRPSNDEDC